MRGPGNLLTNSMEDGRSQNSSVGAPTQDELAQYIAAREAAEA